MKLFTLSLLCSLLSITFSYAQGTPVEVAGSYSATIRSGIAFQGKFIFSAGNELWSTDGTTQGTQQIRRFGPGFLAPNGFTILNNQLYFIANDSTYGAELWVSDGTSTGTNMVKDINPNGNDSAFISNIYNTGEPLVVMNGKLYFAANDGSHGFELWSSDGTNAGTQMVKDIYAVADSSGVLTFAGTSIHNIITTGNMLFFAANDGNGSGIELWASDGTATGTHIVKDIRGGATNSYPRNLIAYQNKVVFTADTAFPYQTAVFISDGTGAGTFDIALGYTSTNDRVVYNNKLYFCTILNDYMHFLSETDGSWLNTNIVDTIGDSFNTLVDYGKGKLNFTFFNNKLYFRSHFYQQGSELWQSDFTTAGTGILKDIVPGNFGSMPFGFTEFGGKLYFRTADSNYVNISYTDGTAAGTQKVVMPGANYTVNNIFVIRSVWANPLVPVGSNLFFANAYFTSGMRVYYFGMFPQGINGSPQVSSIDIYPNPSDGFINIDAENATSVNIHDITGKLVLGQTISSTNNTYRMDIQNIPAGAYTITTLLKDGSKRIGKVVKQ